MRAAIALACLCAVTLSGCGKVAGDTKFDGSIEDRMKFDARVMQMMLPMPLEDGFTLKSIKADGAALVLGIDTTLEGEMDRETPPSELTKLFRPKICENHGFRKIIDEGGIIRFHLTRESTGDALPDFSIAYCG